MVVRLFSFLLLGYALGFALFAVTLPDPAGTERTDAIVVVTGGPGRVQRALDELEAGRARRLLVSGADRRVRKRELAAEYGAPRALVDARVDLGRESVDTRSNADESAAWLAKHGFRSVRLVTTDWHMRRARYELERVLPPNTIVVTDAVRSEPTLVVLLTEYSKYLLRRIAGPLGL